MKRKHPQQEQRSVIKRAQRTPAARQERIHSSVSPTVVSPTGSQDAFSSRSSAHSSPGQEIRIDNAIWHPDMRCQQQGYNQGHHSEERNNAITTSPNSGIIRIQPATDPSQQRSAINESNFINQVVQDATDLDRSLLMDTSFLKPTDHLNTQLHPMPSP
ncbi:Transcription factorfungi [Penicillium sp. IBT 31633x]|nr:Transcription factorfungi [Penicillium sp. IBT 31633x]